MDTELARTFLAVISSGSFLAAAGRLHVSQSTVSARIQRLEALLGTDLFVRDAAECRLTAAGAQFQRHASALVRTVELAKQELGTDSAFQATISVGGRIGLWEDLLSHWLPVFARESPHIAVRAITAFEDELMRDLIAGQLHIGVMYTPQSRPGLTIEPLLNEQLVLVSTDEAQAGVSGPQYVYVDWGPEFAAHHGLAFPDFRTARLSVNTGRLGLEYILANGGSGYFPLRMVRRHQEAGRLVRIKAPEFTLPAYLCFPSHTESPVLALAITSLRKAIAIEDADSPMQ